MKKYEMITQYAAYTAREITQNEENWKKYLTTASRLYKYPFKDQLLIYAQRPDATACAIMEIWNKKMFCWINRNAKGIALLDEKSDTGLKYVFDVSDVHRGGRGSSLPYLWNMEKEHQKMVLERLEAIYGSTNKKLGFSKRIQVNYDGNWNYKRVFGIVKYENGMSFGKLNWEENTNDRELDNVLVDFSVCFCYDTDN